MEKLTLSSLFLLVNIAAVQIGIASAQSGDNDINMNSDITPVSCHIPAHSNLSRVLQNPNEEEVEIEGRCYLACTEKYGVTTTNDSQIPYWPYRVTVIPSRSSQTCYEVHECTRGCVLHFSIGDKRDCQRNCPINCRTECSNQSSCANPDLYDPWIHSRCNLKCQKNPCSSGCLHKLKDAADEDFPHDPIGSPVINPVQSTDRAELYIFTVNISAASPKPQQNETVNQTSIAPVAFLFRIELMRSSDVSFIWGATPITELNLTDYACQELLVSFAVTNEAGLSNFSDPAQVSVHGARIPHPPRNLQVSSEIDTRIGFFGYVTLNISWEEPLNDAYLDQYSITISSNTCGTHERNKTSTTVKTNDTFITIMATNMTEDILPLTNCTYDIQVSSEGIDGNSNPITNSNHTPQFDPMSIGFQCERLWNSTEYFFSFNLTWILPYFLSNGNIIDFFWVSYRMRDSESGQTMTVGKQLKIPFPQNSSMVFSEIVTPNAIGTDGRPYNIPQHDTSQVFQLEMTVAWKRAVERPPSPHNYTCTASTLSPTPTNIENITVESYCFSDDTQITLSFSWSPPSNFNGDPANYSACIGTHALEPKDVVIPNAGHFCTSDSLLPELTRATVTLLHVKISTHLYFQMRANNVYISGNWSEPYQIPLSSMDIGCDYDVSTNSSGLTYSRTSINIGVIVGSLLGGIVLEILLTCCLCVAVWYVRMLRRRKRLQRITEEFCDPMFNSGSKTLHLQNPTVPKLTSPTMDEWEIPANEVIMEKLLGEGAFGEVYKGIVKCPIVNPKVRTLVENAFCIPVAIKLLKLSAKGNERKDFLSEIEMMKKVAEGQNPHVVGLLGCVTIQEPLCLITEFVKFGDLLSYLRMNRRMCTETNTEEDDENDTYLELGNVSPMDLISFAYQIASGMEYLSSLGIVHRDLACRNILVDEGKVLKISDLGMSRETDEIYVQKRTGRVPLKWMAIESIIAREFTSASDVWSFGITLWEIGTLGGFPYPSIQNEDLLSLLKRGHRMEKPDNCSPEVYDIMLMCWNEQPQKRPKFTELRAKFDAMLLAERKDAYIDLRIDNDKPYYRLDTMATVTANGLSLSPNPNRHSFIPSTGSGVNSRSGSKECSPKPLHSPNFSPSHKSQASCCSSTHASPRKPGLGGGLAPSTSSIGHQSPSHNMRDRTQTIASNGERRGEHTRENGRPVSLLLPRDRDRERRERQNPYVDEPSRAAATTLALPNGDGNHLITRRGSDGAIEMNHLRNGGPQSQGAGIEIKVTSESEKN